jgi:DNA-nicking Smr family endonuclease
MSRSQKEQHLIPSLAGLKEKWQAPPEAPAKKARPLPPQAGTVAPAPGADRKKSPGASREESQGASREKEEEKEKEDFFQAMQGVRPIAGKGRALAPPPAPPPPPPAPRESLADLQAGRLEFALEYSEEFLEGHILGLDPKVIIKLRAGRYSPEAHMDLHGLNAEQARAHLLDFIRNAYQQGRRALLVVTGRGKNSPQGQGVLRTSLRDWLTHDPLKRVILAFCTAQPKDGGAGAFYLLLRGRKKKHGKIRWDRAPWEEDPLL